MENTEKKKTKHPSAVFGYNGSFKDLAASIGTMNYEQVAIFIGALADDITEQARKDLVVRNRKRLATELYAAAANLNQAAARIQAAWKICEPYMDVYKDEPEKSSP